MTLPILVVGDHAERARRYTLGDSTAGTGRWLTGSDRVAVGGDGWQLREVVAKYGDLPVADAKDPHKGHRRRPPVGFVEGYVDLGNEDVGIRGVVQDVGGPFQVHRALVA